MDKFVNLHVHTAQGSLLDGLTKVNELFDKTMSLNQPAVAITDHGTLFAVVDAAKYAQKNDYKFIPGFEAYHVENALIKSKAEKSSENDVSRNHLLLLAKNNDGYKRLMKICSWGHTEGFYYRPRIDNSVLERYGTDGIIASSACLAGSIDQALLHDDYEKAKSIAEYYAILFKDGFYLEIQPTYDDGGRQVKVNKGLIELAKELGLPMIATTDSHYLNKDDSIVHDILLCTQSKSLLSDPNRWKFPGQSYYIMSREEILSYFQKNGHEVLDQKIVEEAIDNTVVIADQCNVSFTFGKHYLPKISPPSEEENPELMKQFNIFEKRRLLEVCKQDNVDIEEAKNRLDPSAEYLRFLCIHGWHGIMNQLHLEPRHLSLLFYELDVIISMGFPSYFLIMYDIMNFCHEQKVATGPARGCHCLGTQVNGPFGKMAIEHYHKGDLVIAEDEKPHIVIDKLEYDCDEDIISIVTEDNKILQGTTKDHKVLAIKNSDYQQGIRNPTWYAIGELNVDDYLCEINK